MKNILIMIFTLFITSCVETKINSPRQRLNPEINKEFNIYVESFIKRSQKFGKQYITNNMTIRFNESLSGTYTLGQCYMPRVNFDGIVEINPLFWENATYAERQYLMDHELGHCLLLRDHTNSEIETVDGTTIHSSIMNSKFGSEHAYISNYDVYTQELFTESNKNLVYYWDAVVSSSFDIAFYTNIAMTTHKILKTKMVSNNKESVHSLNENDFNMYKNIEEFDCGEH